MVDIFVIKMSVKLIKIQLSSMYALFFRKLQFSKQPSGQN